MAKRNITLHDKYKSTTALYPKIDAKSLTPDAITEITRITEVVVEEQVVPNPTPTGEEPNLEYITINNVTYKVPTGSGQVQANWNETDTDSPAYIQNKPTIPSAQVQSNWNENDTDSPAYIQNKPSLFSGSYTDLTDKPSLWVHYFRMSYTMNDGTNVVINGTIINNSSDDLNYTSIYNYINNLTASSSGAHRIPVSGYCYNSTTQVYESIVSLYLEYDYGVPYNYLSFDGQRIGSVYGNESLFTIRQYKVQIL